MLNAESGIGLPLWEFPESRAMGYLQVSTPCYFPQTHSSHNSNERILANCHLYTVSCGFSFQPPFSFIELQECVYRRHTSLDISATIYSRKRPLEIYLGYFNLDVKTYLSHTPHLLMIQSAEALTQPSLCSRNVPSRSHFEGSILCVLLFEKELLMATDAC